MFGLAFGGHCDMWVVYSVQQHSNFVVVVSCYGLHITVRLSVCHLKRESTPKISTLFCCLIKIKVLFNLLHHFI